MKKAGNGSIVNASSKFDIRGLTKNAALEFADYGIRVNTVLPGLINTPIVVKEIGEQVAATVPMRRGTEREEVFKLMLFLVSDYASKLFNMCRFSYRWRILGRFLIKNNTN